MKYLRKMIEVFNNTSKKERNRLGGLSDCLADNEVFVFAPYEKDQVHVIDEDRSIDAPFERFSVELSTDKPLSSLPEDEILKIGYDIKTWCILISEIKPNECIFYSLNQSVNRTDITKKIAEEKWMILRVERKDAPAAYDWYVNIIALLFDRIKNEECGIEKVRERIKVKGDHTKYMRTIRKVIHVAQKKVTKKYSTERNKEIDWTHAWSVRGHWRKTNGIGKDRAGNYCVENFTWVKEHLKGPEDKVIIKKQRVVKVKNNDGI